MAATAPFVKEWFGAIGNWWFALIGLAPDIGWMLGLPSLKIPPGLLSALVLLILLVRSVFAFSRVATERDHLALAISNTPTKADFFQIMVRECAGRGQAFIDAYDEVEYHVAATTALRWAEDTRSQFKIYDQNAADAFLGKTQLADFKAFTEKRADLRPWVESLLRRLRRLEAGWRP